MTIVEIAGDRLRVRLDGWARVWAFKGGLDIPLAHVRAVEPAPPDVRPRGLRAPGAYWPGLIAAGTYRRPGRTEFWSVRDKRKAIVVDLEGDRYARLVLEVPDPAATLTEIREAIGRGADVDPSC